MRAGFVHEFNGTFCVDYQKRTSCHACGHGPAEGTAPCWTLNPDCRYVRHNVWEREDAPDARATGSSAPDLFYRARVELDPPGHGGSRLATIDDRSYVVGTASGEGCNCLIYSLIAAVSDYFRFLGIAETVRELLMVEFGAPGDAQVTESNVLYFLLRTLRFCGTFPGFHPWAQLTPSSQRSSPSAAWRRQLVWSLTLSAMDRLHSSFSTSMMCTSSHFCGKEVVELGLDIYGKP